MPAVAITEIFNSFQGEGSTVGRRATFVRFFGCNMYAGSCKFCDSMYAVNGKTNLQLHFNYESTDKAIDAKVKTTRRVVFTGGEPMLQYKYIKHYIEPRMTNIDFEIETNGIKKIDFTLPEYVQFNISPKLRNSFRKPMTDTQYETYCKKLAGNIDSALHLYPNSILKFVVNTDTEETAIIDLHEIESFVARLAQYPYIQNKLYLMPMGTDSQTILKGIKMLNEIQNRDIITRYNIGARLHVLVYENKKGV